MSYPAKPTSLKFQMGLPQDRHEDGCWIWAGRISSTGYGIILHNRKIVGAHRISWMLNRGEIPQGMFVCHKCDNPRCVNPNHLFLGTQKDNMADAAIKGRVRLPMLKGSTHPNSKLNEENVVEIRSRANGGENYKSIAAIFGVSRDCIYAVCKRKNWGHVL